MAGEGALRHAKHLARALKTLDWDLEGMSSIGRPSHDTIVVSMDKRKLLPYARRLHEWPLDADDKPEGPGRSYCGHQMERLTYAHFLWAVACPCLDWISQALDDAKCAAWTPALGQCLNLLAPDFMCEEMEETGQDAMAETCSFLLYTHLQVVVPADSIACVLGPLLHSGLPTCGMSAHLLLMAEVMETFIGKALHETLRCRLLAMAARIPEPTPAEPLEDR